MSSKWQPGQLLFVGFEGLELPRDVARLIAAGRVGGVVLFARNIDGPEQVRSLSAALHACAPAGAPLLIAIDQEGGRIQRLRDPWTLWPPMQRLGEVDDPEVTAAVGRALAVELLDLGIGLDFAPCVDVDTNPANPIIGDRSFGSEPMHVAAHAAHFIRSMQEAGVASCAKHFPGHGDTSCDSHLELPRLDHDLARLRAVELPPFASAIEAGVASIMTAHILFPALDAKRPATLAPDVMAILREELAYDGVVFSDDLEMKAVADHHSPKALVDGCLEAGVDSLLVCKDPGLRDEVLRGLERAPDARLENPLRRMIDLKQRFAGLREPLERADREPIAPPYAEHLALAGRFA
ncbi:MAG: beta-N-acetylhexosaminidase [Deltaproteobacteria bacterium]|nr:beta-N-acetylhexosaminidase [Deltaproteobacteria bacterium]